VKPVAFLDASVLYPATLRSVLMFLAAKSAFVALWSERVHEERMAALAADRPDLSPRNIARVRSLMEAHVDEATVTRFEGRIPELTLPDPDDRHVLAAAIQGRAQVIVTTNLKDFPVDVLAPYAITALHPDVFIAGLVDSDPDAVITALAADRARLRNPPMTAAIYLASLLHAGLPATVAALKSLADRL
jgi:predicted nucleic acid-binding protein